MPYGIIYKWTCNTTGMSYIGQTVCTLQRRWSGHKQQAKKGGTWEFHKAIRQYGSENFEGHILQECLTSQELDEAEKRFISDLNTTWPNGYNMRNGGQYTSDESRQKMSLAKKGSKLSEEHKQRISESLKGHEGYWTGKSHDEESNRKRSDALKGRSKTPFSEDHKRRISESKKGSTPWNKGRKKGSS